MEKFKLEAISFAQTFGATFLTAVGTTIISVPVTDYGQLLTNGFWASTFLAAVRVALKFAWQRLLPESVGGNPKTK